MRASGQIACRRLFALGAGVVLAIVCLGACQPSGFEFKDAAYHSPHFDYLFHADDTTVCPDVMDSLEQYQALLAGYLGIEQTTLPRVTYFKLRDASEYRDRNAAGQEASANAGHDFVVSPLPFDEHELIHTITLGAWGYTAPFLEEGIAAALSCDPAAVEVTSQPYADWNPNRDALPYESNPAHVALYAGTAPATLAQLYDVYSIPGVGETAAGAMTTYLIDVAGVAKLHQLWASVSPSTSEAELSATLKKIVGFSLDEVWQTMQTTRHRPCAPVWMCSLPPITEQEQGVLRSTCTGKELGRPTSGNLRLQYPPFSHDAYEMLPGRSGSTVVATGISLIPCDGDPANYLPRDPEMQFRTLQADSWIPPLTVPNVVTLETFAWVLDDQRTTYNSPGGQMPYQTQPLEPATTRCSQAVANIIPPNTTSALWLPNDSQTHYARFQLDVKTRGDLYFDVSVYDSASGSPPAGLTAVLCTGCDGDDASNCNGCPFGTTDCIVKFQNSTSLPLWLRIVAGDYWSSSQWAAVDGGTFDAGEGLDTR